MYLSWQTELAHAYTNPRALLEYLQLDATQFPQLAAAAATFPFKVTQTYAEQMRKGDPGDPLLRQVLPLAEELRAVPGFGLDPVGDLAAAAAPGLLHKYRGRALLVTTGACAIHCRYCFRRDFPYDEQQLARRRESVALAAIAGDPGISEVILSGGDPLALGDERLGQLIRAIAEIPQIRRLRLHTRIPVVLPSRLTQALLDNLTESRLGIVVVIHANHPRELGSATRAGLAVLSGRGFLLLNQSVLLRGINDDADTLAQLSETLADAGTLPYYLHLLDRARGTAHFEVEENRALELMESLRARLPGYLVPRLVREVAGEACKRPVG